MVDIHEFVELTSYPMYDSFILTEYNDNVSVFMTDDMKQHLFDLETETEGAITFDLLPENREWTFDDEDNEDVLEEYEMFTTWNEKMQGKKQKLMTNFY
jgi:hypothetical protein